MLPWPEETVDSTSAFDAWHQAGSNLCLDFHGNPVDPDLVVLSDGNHHMALHDVIRQFGEAHAQVGPVFYVTLPPSAIKGIIRTRGLRVGNIVLPIVPDVVLGPPQLFASMPSGPIIENLRGFMASRGTALLISKENPKQIRGIADLARPDVRMFISNPDTESVSYLTYEQQLRHAAAEAGVSAGILDAEQGRIVYGERVHHREAPQAVADGRADVAIVYYHLALRYRRVFPDVFDWRPLLMSSETGGVASSHILASSVNPANPAGTLFFDYLMSDEVTEIYTYHGLERMAQVSVSKNGNGLS